METIALHEVSGRPETFPPERFAADPYKLPGPVSESDERIAGRPETYAEDILEAGHLDEPTPTAGPPYDSVVGKPETWPPESFDQDPNVPAPAVTTLTPDTAVIGGADFTLSVAGDRLGDEAVIVFAGRDEPTTFVSPQELTTGVDMSVWTAPDTVQVQVRGSNGLLSNALPFTFT